jgi:hypothetical protein
MRMLNAAAAATRLGTFTLVGCGAPTAIVDYRQVGACNGYVAGNRVVSAGPNSAYVFFAVDSIDNSQTAQDFAFDPTRLFINDSPPEHVTTGLLVASDLGFAQMAPITVPHGAQVAVRKFGVVVVPTQDSDGARQANQTNYFLLYDAAVPPNALEEKSGSGPWPDTPDCRSIKFQ